MKFLILLLIISSQLFSQNDWQDKEYWKKNKYKLFIKNTSIIDQEIKKAISSSLILIHPSQNKWSNNNARGFFAGNDNRFLNVETEMMRLFIQENLALNFYRIDTQGKKILIAKEVKLQESDLHRGTLINDKTISQIDFSELKGVLENEYNQITPINIAAKAIGMNEKVYYAHISMHDKKYLNWKIITTKDIYNLFVEEGYRTNCLDNKEDLNNSIYCIYRNPTRIYPTDGALIINQSGELVGVSTGYIRAMNDGYLNGKVTSFYIN